MIRIIILALFVLNNFLLVNCYNRRFDYGQYYGHLTQRFYAPSVVTSALNGDGSVAGMNGGSGVTTPIQITDNQLVTESVTDQTGKSEVEALTAPEETTTVTTEATTTVIAVDETTTTPIPTTVTAEETTTTTTTTVAAEETTTETTTTTEQTTTQGTTTTEGTKKPGGNFDNYLDTILGNLAKALRQGGFDPLKIGRMLQCRNCTLDGLSLIRRVGPANLVYANRSLVIDAYLGLPALYISCMPCVDVIFTIPFSGMLEVALWNLQIYGKVSQKFHRGASPTLVEYRVEREGELDIKLNGYGLLAPMAELGFKFIHQRQVSNIIRQLVYERIPAFIQEKLKGFNLPIGKR